ncbi:MAG: RNA polymerase sigma factor [candidate division Zixibacteria bacterium]|nr:RNA polymerase sigma factor [candidate division Zixibacteria bacterium]MDH3938430.1 RNA polymerase sigma factor [candidate division Zixibacteria bacterium]MDH4035147.1 RNA polymerase sigma factor [candidate division Zixibacteria bacterium]
MQETKELFWKLMEPEYVRATLYCRKLCGDRDRADDLLQDVMVKAMTKFSDLRNNESFRPWLYRILISTFRDSIRRPWWQRRVSLTPEIESDHAVTDPVNRFNARRWLDLAFTAVSPDEQALVTLHELEQWSIAELAQLYDKSESAIKVRLHRARQKMKKRLKKLLADIGGDSELTNINGINQCIATRPNGE